MLNLAPPWYLSIEKKDGIKRVKIEFYRRVPPYEPLSYRNNLLMNLNEICHFPYYHAANFMSSKDLGKPVNFKISTLNFLACSTEVSYFGTYSA